MSLTYLFIVAILQLTLLSDTYGHRQPTSPAAAARIVLCILDQYVIAKMSRDQIELLWLGLWPGCKHTRTINKENKNKSQEHLGAHELSS